MMTRLKISTMSSSHGYVKLHRKLFENKLWLSEKFTKAQAWIDLFANANHKEGFFTVRGSQIKIKRGQIGWSEVTMAKRWRWNRRTVRRFLSGLEKEQQIAQQKNRITSITTILNYDTYQTERTTEYTTKRTAERTTKRTQTINTNNDKEGIPSKAGALRAEQFRELIDGFEEINPMYTDFYKNTTERKALEDMAEKWSYEKLLKTIQELPRIIGQPYAPRITRPTELRRDIGKLIAFYQQEKNKKAGEKPVVLL